MITYAYAFEQLFLVLGVPHLTFMNELQMNHH